MKDYLKNPNLYYILTPILACAWVIFASTVSLRAANSKYEHLEREFKESEKVITQILALDPERLNYKVKEDSGAEFDYSSALEDIAKLCKISSSNYSISGGRTTKTGGQNRKTANVTIKSIKIEPLAQFLSQILIQWPNLECEVLTITKLKTAKDAWKTSMKFSYTYEK